MGGSASQVAGLASLGNFMWGCDSAAMAGSLLFLVPALGLSDHPSAVGALVSTALCGSFCGTLLAGPLADALGRKPMLVACAALFLSGQLLQLSCGKSLAALVVARCTVGVSEGLIATLVPLLISECSPSNVRGQLASLPQLMGILGMGATYSCLLGMALAIPEPPWHLMLSIGMVPAVVYLCLLVVAVPESPRWLAQHGRHAEAESILRSLVGPEQCASGNPMLEELLLLGGVEADGEEEGPSAAEKGIGPIPPPLSPVSPPIPPLLQLQPGLLRDGAAQEHASPGQPGGTPRTVLRTWSEASLGYGRRASGSGDWSEEHRSPQGGDGGGGMVMKEKEREEWRAPRGNVTTDCGRASAAEEGYTKQAPGQGGIGPEISPRHEEGPADGKSSAKDLEAAAQPSDHDIVLIHLPMTRSFPQREAHGGGSWPLWLSGFCSMCGVAARCWGLCGIWGLAVGSSQKKMFERRVLRALFVCILLQVLQQASGISAIFCYLPTLLEASVDPSVGHVAPLHGPEAHLGSAPGAWSAAGNATRALAEGIQQSSTALRSEIGSGSGSGSEIANGVLRATAVLGLVGSGAHGEGHSEEEGGGAGLALGKESTALLAGAATAVLMAPFAALSLYLLDSLGRRRLLLNTVPLVSLSLLCATLSTTLMRGSPLAPVATALSLAAYCCTFTLGLGPIPNIVTSEVFPPHVRGLCVSLSVGVSWLCAIAVSFTLPRLQASLGEEGVFGALLLASLATWAFVYAAVPETKGLPLDTVARLFD